jgi:hypothetical protein
MTSVCPECHHRPSDRNDPGDFSGPALECFCKCHDVADAAPELLAACRAALGRLNSLIDTSHFDDVKEQLHAAIAKVALPPISDL